jgi:hypothetical protein
MPDCACDIREEVHDELPDAPVEYIVEYACPRHRYDARGLQMTAGVGIAGLPTTATTPAGHTYTPDDEGNCWECGNSRDDTQHADEGEKR